MEKVRCLKCGSPLETAREHLSGLCEKCMENATWGGMYDPETGKEK